MAEAKNGDTVKVHYKGTLEDGTIFDSSHERGPLEFTLGENKVIEAFERAVVGMGEGDNKNVTIPPEEAYGDYQDNLVIELERDKVPPDISPEVGMMLQLTSDDGRATNVLVTDVSDQSITLDANHPLAGKTLNFEINLVEIG